MRDAPTQLAPLIIGVTSHRNLVEGEIRALRERVRDFFAGLHRQYPQLPLVVLSALAEGGDRLVAEEGLDCGARLITVLPLPESLYLDDFANPESREEFLGLSVRSQVLQMSLLPRNSETGVAVPGSQRDAQYAEAGVFIASHCHILVAIWDGRDSDLFGGTAQIVRYHLDGVLPGPIERRRGARPLFDRGDESLIYHLACSRDDAVAGLQGPQQPLQPLQARWLSQDRERAYGAGMPAEFAVMFQRMVEFNTDAQRYRDEIEQARSTDTSEATGGADDAPGMLFASADWLAMHFQKRVLLAMRGIHVLAALMGIAFVGYSDLPGDWGDLTPMIDLFIALFITGVLLDRIAGRRAWHRKYIDYRALAEGLRVQDYWRRAGIAAADSVAFAHDNFMQKQDVELGWIRNVMRVAGLHASDRENLPRATIEAVIDDWIGAPGHGGQLDYYARKTEERSRVNRAAQLVGGACLWAGIGLGVVLALFHRALGADTSTTLVAVIGVLAIIAAVRESYTYRKADKELVKQYRFMRNLFASARSVLDSQEDSHARREVLRALGEAALAEHAEWALMHRERPLEHGRL